MVRRWAGRVLCRLGWHDVPVLQVIITYPSPGLTWRGCTRCRWGSWERLNTIYTTGTANLRRTVHIG